MKNNTVRGMYVIELQLHEDERKEVYIYIILKSANGFTHSASCIDAWDNGFRV